jgi:serine/threonine-protein kinase RsbW
VFVFLVTGGQFFSWENGQERHPVTDLAGTAVRLLRSADRDPACAECRPAIEHARKTWHPPGPADEASQGGESMTQRVSTPARVMMSESSWRCTRTYIAEPDQVQHARTFLRGVLERCPMADDAALLISELCTNAVQHSDSREPCGVFTVHVEVYAGQYVWAEVEDCGGLWEAKDRRNEGGHGLEIVRKVASEWGRDGDAATGWVVWFRLDWPAT